MTRSRIRPPWMVPPGKTPMLTSCTTTSRAWMTMALLALLLAAGGCRQAYYSALEKVGIEKRELLVDRVESARQAQGEAEQAYVDALEQFRTVVAFDGGDLERMYSKLDSELADARAEAEAFGSRIDAVENVAEALFEEWERELDEYQDASLRRQSQGTLQQTRRRYADVQRAMRRAEASFQPALASLNDKVLFLKHNLNAAALGSIRGELPSMEADARRLRESLRRADAEASKFLASMRG